MVQVDLFDMWIMGIYCSGIYCYWVDVIEYGGFWIDFCYVFVNLLQMWDGLQCVYDVVWFQCIGDCLFQVMMFINFKIGYGVGFIVVNLKGDYYEICILQCCFLVGMVGNLVRSVC